MLQLPSILTMQGPTGLSGLHRVPNNGQSFGDNNPLNNSPHLHPFGSLNSLFFKSSSSLSYFLRASYILNCFLKSRPDCEITGKRPSIDQVVQNPLQPAELCNPLK